LVELAELQAVVLVGGLGTRLRSAVADRPKALAPVGGRPFLDWLLLALRDQGVRRVVLATGHLGDAFDRHMAGWRSLGLDVALSRESSPLGTGGAARLAVDRVETDRVLILNGDSYCRFDLARLGAPPAIWLVEVADASRYGSVELDDDGLVRSFREKIEAAGPGLVNAGVYLLDRADVAAIPPGRDVSLEREVLPGLVGRGLRGVVGSGTFVDIGTPESYSAADRLFGAARVAAPAPGS
jgi:D-glycero-alpha-D-manno-heptose 1-phosphate guanylyltransferase